MRILLATAVALAPLLTASGAMAEVVINTARTTPITTGNATGTGADTIRIAGGGSIALTSGVAVTLNSSHNVTIDTGGTITMANAADGATGILVNPGNTANVRMAGSIVITDNITSETDVDTDNDGDADGPLANGTGRYGIRFAGPGVHTGNLLTEGASSIVVEGNNSAGVSIESDLTGRVDLLGVINVTGNNSYGLHTTGAVNGPVNVTGTINARGENTIGAAIEGDVSGRVMFGGSIIASGFRYTSAPPERPEGYVETPENDDDVLFLDELDADDLLTGGPAVLVAANVGAGVIFDAPPTYSAAGIEGDDDNDGVKNGDEDDDGDGTKNRDDTDRDGDGVPDANEGTASITSFGSGPAVQIGSATESITLGVAGTGDSAYGLINRGSFNAQGVYAGFDANALVVGGNAGQTVDINGGIRNEGTITAVAVEADATAVRLGSGTNTPTFINNLNITAGVLGDDAAGTAGAIRIDAGANLPSLVNNGTIIAGASGTLVDSRAIQDLSGTLTSITNTGSIETNLIPNADGDATTGSAVAIDVAANTTGVTLLQTGVAGTPTSSDPDSDGDGVPNSQEPAIIGDVLFGSGADVMDIRNGTVTGDISFGAGADRLDITGGGIVRGAISDSDGDLSITVANGVLDARQGTAQTISDLNVGANGTLIVSIDPANNLAGGFNVTGNANLAAGAGVGVRFNSLLAPGAGTQRFELINAGSLTAGTLDLTQTQNNSPYLYVVEAGVDAGANQVYADVRQRTTDEAGMIAVEAGLYDAFYNSLTGTSDSAIALRDAFLAQTSRDGFFDLYEQLLPDHSGGPLLSLASGVDAVTRALTGRNASAAPGETSAWVQEINFYADKDKTDTYGFRSEGFGVAGGVERGTGLGAVGLSVAFTSSDLEDPEAEAEEVLSANLLEMGLYWRAQGQYWTTWARAAAGYATFESERRFVGAGLNLTSTSDWNGLTLSAAAGASYERNFGRFSIRPEGYVEYFSLSEDGHTEEGGGDGFDLEIDDRDGHMFSATAAINIGMSMGQNSWLKPELRLGWRQNISVDPGETIARFRSGGPDFALSPDTIEGGGPIVGFRLNVGNELGMLSVSADAEMLDNYVRYMLFLRASFRF
ncbi:autotransporter domain-containing protein [Brevundimonas sp. GCM10030266]|uniref:autotransporter outer membrane beta-barrel domain-containing protein n=1 Tax=Brevundimonas sp. GCM10030266 TaxID=3273386 RepID=UPI00361ED869